MATENGRVVSCRPHSVDAVYFERLPRRGGKTSFNGWKLWNFALECINFFISATLKIWYYFWLFISLISLLYGLFIAVKTIVSGIDIPGYASTIVVILFPGGFN